MDDSKVKHANGGCKNSLSAGQVDHWTSVARKLLASLPERIRRNADFFDAVRAMVASETEAEREKALKAFTIWGNRKLIEIETDRARGAAKGFASTLLANRPEVIRHAKSVPHLGALAPLAPLPATRWDYGSLLLRVLLEMKKGQSGLGLGSSNFGIKHGQLEITGLEITQTWALLGGYGHLFGTFATERALLFVLDGDHALEREFTIQLAAEIRPAAEAILRTRDMYRFFYVLAAWRVSQWSPSATRSTCLKILNPLLSLPPDEPGWSKLLWAFRRARQITYTRLHAMLGVNIASSPIPIDSAIRALRANPKIGFIDEASEPSGAVAELIDSLDRFYGDVFFTSPAASARVLAHLREFKNWWATSRTEPLADRINALMQRPHAWPQASPQQRQHLVRLLLPDGGAGWPHEVRRWLASEKGEGTWRAGNFLITPHRRRDSDCNVVDVYVGSQPDAPLVAHVAALLAERNESTWTTGKPADDSVRLWRSIAEFALGLLQLMLGSDRIAQLEPVAATDGIGLAIAAKSVESGRARLRDFARRVKDRGRQMELDALDELASKYKDQSATWIAFLGRVRILEKESGRQLQELDGIFALVTVSGVEWHFVEHKESNGAGLCAQLNELGQHILGLPSCEWVGVARGKAAHTSISWAGGAHVAGRPKVALVDLADRP